MPFIGDYLYHSFSRKQLGERENGSQKGMAFLTMSRRVIVCTHLYSALYTTKAVAQVLL